MKEKETLGTFLILLLINSVGGFFGVPAVKADPAIWRVPIDFGTIQEAIDAAQNEDTVLVYNGTYFVNETIFIENKEISLVGQNPTTTIIDGGGMNAPIIHIFNTSDVIVSNFTVRNTTSGFESYGISTYQIRNVTIQNNIVTKTYYGILLSESNGCRVLDNKITDNHNAGIVLRGGSSYNKIIGNLIEDSPNGIYIEPYSQDNIFYRNNIINNTRQLNIFPPASSSWDNGVEGNYWDDYKGIDLNGDGVGDTELELPHLGVDSYPLIEPWNETRTFIINSHKTVVKCNYTVASFTFNQTLRQISFYITGPPGWKGFCNVTVPKELLSPENASEKWLVMLGSNPITYANESIDSSTLISFTYTLGPSPSDNKVRLRVGTVYPPTAGFEFTPDVASTIEPVNFTDTSVESPNGTIVWRQWNFGDGTIVYNETFVRHQFEDKTLFNVMLTVRDNNSLTDSITKLVWVRNLKPLANFTFSPAELFVGSEVEFNATLSRDLDGNITKYRWNFEGSPTVVQTNPVIVHVFDHVKTFKVNLTVVDNDGAENWKTQLVAVGRGLTIIEIEAPNAVKVEEPFIVNVTLRNYSGQPLAEQQIEIAVYDNGLTLSENSTTDNNGVATANFSLSTVGQSLIKAEYYGSDDYVGSNNTAFIMVSSVNTTLDIFVPENATQNETFAIFAVLQDEDERPVYNVTVEFYFYNGSSWKLLGTSITNQSGVASFSYVPHYAGTFMLKAVFNGTGTYAPSYSGEQSFTVASSEVDYTLYIILAAVIAVAVCLVFIALKKRSFFKGAGG